MELNGSVAATGWMRAASVTVNSGSSSAPFCRRPMTPVTRTMPPAGGVLLPVDTRTPDAAGSLPSRR